MDFALDDEQLAWRAEIRSFLREHFTPELARIYHAEGNDSTSQALAGFRRLLGARRWLQLNWPVEYGGLGLGPLHQHLLTYEFEYHGAPGLDLTVTSVAPMIIRHGTDRNRAEFLPPIARGELTCAVGYSEPDAGTDLASLTTRAVLDGDEWVIDGQKIWNSQAHVATHEWLCVRTDPAAPKHDGISVIMVPLDAPGIEVRPLRTWDGFRTNLTHFTGVRVPRTNLVGEPGRGWQYITGALTLERGALAGAGELRRLLDAVTAGAPSDPVVRRHLADLEADVEVVTLLGLEAASQLESGASATVASTEAKIVSSELRQRIADLGTRLHGLAGVLDGAPFEKPYRAAPLMRFGAGTNEVLRDLIASRTFRQEAPA